MNHYNQIYKQDIFILIYIKYIIYLFNSHNQKVTEID